MSGFGEKVRTLQWLDRRVGVPLCFVLTLLRNVGDLFGGRDADGSGRSIVFLKLAEQGSTVLAYDALVRAVQRVGRENVYFLVFENNRFVVDVLGLLPDANVLTVRTASPWTMASSGLARLRQIRQLGIDACIDMEFFTRFSAAIAWLTGARQRVGFHTYFGEGPYRGDLMTHRVLYNPHLHTARLFTSLVMALDQSPTRFPTFPAIPPLEPAIAQVRISVAERAEAQQIVRAAGIREGQRVVLLNANASDLLPLRKWDGDNYVVLAQRLLHTFDDAVIAFTGASVEAPAINELAARVDSPRCVSLAGRTTLRQLLAIYELAGILVTNDSGPAHFASMTTIDVVALFGPETPALFSALGPRSHPVWLGLACSPCVNAFNNRQTACRDNQCMKQIAVEQVFDVVCRIYRERGVRPVACGDTS
ncbi:MAG: glycosyltransferase family 9 protein [Opitutaceae bacterium]|nr:glycosyltransferase family 9 protein [Opitutaceae bacterium]